MSVHKDSHWNKEFNFPLPVSGRRNSSKAAGVGQNIKKIRLIWIPQYLLGIRCSVYVYIYWMLYVYFMSICMSDDVVARMRCTLYNVQQQCKITVTSHVWYDVTYAITCQVMTSRVQLLLNFPPRIIGVNKLPNFERVNSYSPTVEGCIFILYMYMCVWRVAYTYIYIHRYMYICGGLHIAASTLFKRESFLLRQFSFVIFFLFVWNDNLV